MLALGIGRRVFGTSGRDESSAVDGFGCVQKSF
jgi:hypothetical protein